MLFYSIIQTEKVTARRDVIKRQKIYIKIIIRESEREAYKCETRREEKEKRRSHN